MFAAASVSSASAKRSITFGISAAILLVVGYLTFFWMPYLGWAAGLVALFFGIKSLRQPYKLQRKDVTMATAGTAIGVVSVLYLIVSIVLASLSA